MGTARSSNLTSAETTFRRDLILASLGIAAEPSIALAEDNMGEEGVLLLLILIDAVSNVKLPWWYIAGEAPEADRRACDVESLGETTERGCDCEMTDADAVSIGIGIITGVFG